MPFIPRPAGRGEKLANVSIGSFRSEGELLHFFNEEDEAGGGGRGGGGGGGGGRQQGGVE